MSQKFDLKTRLHELKEYDKAYQEGHPLIDDGSYDTLYCEFIDYVKSHPEEITPEIESYVNNSEPDLMISGKSKIRHPYPILSLAKSQTIEGLENYLDKWNSQDPKSEWYTDKFLVERKEDGLTVVLYFNDPHMKKKFIAVTRGGGQEGQDITDKVMNFINLDIPDLIKKVGNRHLVIRGEAMIDDADFDSINKNHEFANSRNAASGTLMANDPSLVKSRKMKFYAYTLVNEDEFIDQGYTELDTLDLIQRLGIEITGGIAVFDNTDEGKAQLIQYVKDYDNSLRSKVGHAIDGLVLKPNDIIHLDEIGYTGHHPNFDIAYKFKAKSEVAVLQKVIWQKSINGKLTPVGVLDHPVNILGATIQRASLASIQNIENRDIKLYDHVIIRRSNDVIPQIVKSIPELRTGKEIDIHELIPKDAVRKGAVLYEKPDTKEQLFQSWIKFVGHDGLNIEGLSGQTLKSMIDNGIIDINDYSSLWRIDHDRFVSIKGLGENKYYKIIDQINHVKPDLRNILLSLPIEGMGYKLADTIASTVGELIPDDFSNIKRLEDLVWNELQKKSGFGPHTKAILDKLFTQEYFDKLAKISEYVPLVHYEDNSYDEEQENGILNGYHFVITGKFDIPRKEIEKIIIENGGSIDSGIKPSTDFLLKNGNRESNKTKKARQLGTKIIDWNQFIDILND